MTSEGYPKRQAKGSQSDRRSMCKLTVLHFFVLKSVMLLPEGLGNPFRPSSFRNTKEALETRASFVCETG